MSDPAATKALMKWYVDAGVDETIADVPQDRFAQHAEALAAKAAAKAQPRVQTGPGLAEGPMPSLEPDRSQLSQTAAPSTVDRSAGAKRPLVKPPAPPAQSDQQAIGSAVELAGKAETLDELRAALEGFDGCALKKTAGNLCFTDGNPKAKVLIVGEAPGAEEDRQGLPFVGPSGQLLDAMLASIGLDRKGEGDAAVLISNTVFWRPPGNRTPTPQETALCLPFIERLIEITGPKVLVCVGGPSAKELLGQAQGITRLRGKWFDYSTPRMAAPIPAMALFHPAYLLRSPAMKRDAWRDLLMLREKLK